LLAPRREIIRAIRPPKRDFRPRPGGRRILRLPNPHPIRPAWTGKTLRNFSRGRRRARALPGRQACGRVPGVETSTNGRYARIYQAQKGLSEISGQAPLLPGGTFRAAVGPKRPAAAGGATQSGPPPCPAARGKRPPAAPRPCQLPAKAAASPAAGTGQNTVDLGNNRKTGPAFRGKKTPIRLRGRDRFAAFPETVRSRTMLDRDFNWPVK